MTQSPEHDVIWLTQEAFDKLQDELEHLRGPMRDEIVVLPGHGGQTTIGREKATNPYLQDLEIQQI